MGDGPFRRDGHVQQDSEDFVLKFGGSCPTDLEDIFAIIKQLDGPLRSMGNVNALLEGKEDILSYNWCLNAWRKTDDFLREQGFIFCKVSSNRQGLTIWYLTGNDIVS